MVILSQCRRLENGIIIGPLGRSKLARISSQLNAIKGVLANANVLEATFKAGAVSERET